MDLAQFEQAVAADRMPSHLDIIQFDSRWRSDDVAMEIRDRLDARIYREFLCGGDLVVRRLLFYDIPSDEREHSRRSSNHIAWVDGLARDLHYLGMPPLGTDARYRIKQVIANRADKPEELPPDGISVAADATWTEQFEELWRQPRSIENNVAPKGLVSGPEADRDPNRDLWR